MHLVESDKDMTRHKPVATCVSSTSEKQLGPNFKQANAVNDTLESCEGNSIVTPTQAFTVLQQNSEGQCNYPGRQEYTRHSEAINISALPQYANKNIVADTEPRAIYIALRESKQATTIQQEPEMETNRGQERYNIVSTFNDNFNEGNVEYVTFEECCLLGEENVDTECKQLNISGLSSLNPLPPGGECPRVLVQPVFTQIGHCNQADENGFSSISAPPVGSVNPPLPTEPLTLEEAIAIEKRAMGISSTNSTSLSIDTHEKNSRFTETIAIPPNQPPDTDFSPAAASMLTSSPPLSHSPVYSLPESPPESASAAIKRSRRRPTRFQSAGSVSPSASSTSSGSQMYSASSTSKSPVHLIDESKRTRQYSESALAPLSITCTNRARHQSDGNVHRTTLTKKTQVSRRNSEGTRKAPCKRRSKNLIPDGAKDEKYWRRRFKNNEAAKRSREVKRMKEDEVVQKLQRLEEEHEKLRMELERAHSTIRTLQDRLEGNMV